MREALEKARPFTLEGALGNMKCPYLILHGGYDVLGVEQATLVHEYAKRHGVNVTLNLVGEDETGAEHCQHDNPTIGQEYLTDWLADVFGIDQKELLGTSLHPLICIRTVQPRGGPFDARSLSRSEEHKSALQ